VDGFEGRSRFIFTYFLIAFAKIAPREQDLIRKAGKQEWNGKARMKFNQEARKTGTE
jgi:hypothetical protein